MLRYIYEICRCSSPEQSEASCLVGVGSNAEWSRSGCEEEWVAMECVIVMRLKGCSAALHGQDTPSHPSDTSDHGDPSCTSREASFDRVDHPASSCIRVVSARIGSYGIGNDCSVDGCLVLLIVHDGSGGHCDGRLRGWPSEVSRHPGFPL